MLLLLRFYGVLPVQISLISSFRVASLYSVYLVSSTPSISRSNVSRFRTFTALGDRRKFSFGISSGFGQTIGDFPSLKFAAEVPLVGIWSLTVMRPVVGIC